MIDLSHPAPYVAVQAAFDPIAPAGSKRHYWKSIDLARLDGAAIDTLLERAAARPSTLSPTAVWHFGGAMSRVDPTATAFWRRSVPYMVSFDAMWDNQADDEAAIAWSRASVEAVRPYSDGGQYVNFGGNQTASDVPARAACGGNYDRLVSIKRRYDPDNLFRLNTNISPG